MQSSSLQQSHVPVGFRLAWLLVPLLNARCGMCGGALQLLQLLQTLASTGGSAWALLVDDGPPLVAAATLLNLGISFLSAYVLLLVQSTPAAMVAQLLILTVTCVAHAMCGKSLAGASAPSYRSALAIILSVCRALWAVPPAVLAPGSSTHTTPAVSKASSHRYSDLATGVGATSSPTATQKQLHKALTVAARRSSFLAVLPSRDGHASVPRLAHAYARSHTILNTNPNMPSTPLLHSSEVDTISRRPSSGMGGQVEQSAHHSLSLLASAEMMHAGNEARDKEHSAPMPPAFHQLSPIHTHSPSLGPAQPRSYGVTHVQPHRLHDAQAMQLQQQQVQLAQQARHKPAPSSSPVGYHAGRDAVVCAQVLMRRISSSGAAPPFDSADASSMFMDLDTGPCVTDDASLFTNAFPLAREDQLLATTSQGSHLSRRPARRIRITDPQRQLGQQSTAGSVCGAVDSPRTRPGTAKSWNELASRTLSFKREQGLGADSASVRSGHDASSNQSLNELPRSLQLTRAHSQAQHTPPHELELSTSRLGQGNTLSMSGVRPTAVWHAQQRQLFPSHQGSVSHIADGPSSSVFAPCTLQDRNEVHVMDLSGLLVAARCQHSPPATTLPRHVAATAAARTLLQRDTPVALKQQQEGESTAATSITHGPPPSAEHAVGVHEVEWLLRTEQADRDRLGQGSLEESRDHIRVAPVHLKGEGANALDTSLSVMSDPGSQSTGHLSTSPANTGYLLRASDMLVARPADGWMLPRRSMQLVRCSLEAAASAIRGTMHHAYVRLQTAGTSASTVPARAPGLAALRLSHEQHVLPGNPVDIAGRFMMDSHCAPFHTASLGVASVPEEGPLAMDPALPLSSTHMLMSSSSGMIRGVQGVDMEIAQHVAIGRLLCLWNITAASIKCYISIASLGARVSHLACLGLFIHPLVTYTHALLLLLAPRRVYGLRGLLWLAVLHLTPSVRYVTHHVVGSPIAGGAYLVLLYPCIAAGVIGEEPAAFFSIYPQQFLIILGLRSLQANYVSMSELVSHAAPEFVLGFCVAMCAYLATRYTMIHLPRTAALYLRHLDSTSASTSNDGSNRRGGYQSGGMPVPASTQGHLPQQNTSHSGVSSVGLSGLHVPASSSTTNSMPGTSDAFARGPSADDIRLPNADTPAVPLPGQQHSLRALGRAALRHILQLSSQPTALVAVLLVLLGCLVVKDNHQQATASSTFLAPTLMNPLATFLQSQLAISHEAVKASSQGDAGAADGWVEFGPRNVPAGHAQATSSRLDPLQVAFVLLVVVGAGVLNALQQLAVRMSLQHNGQGQHAHNWYNTQRRALQALSEVDVDNADMDMLVRQLANATLELYVGFSVYLAFYLDGEETGDAQMQVFVLQAAPDLVPWSEEILPPDSLPSVHTACAANKAMYIRNLHQAPPRVCSVFTGRSGHAVGMPEQLAVPDLARLHATLGARSAIIAPLVYGHHRLGGLVVLSREADAVDEVLCQLSAELAVQLAQALYLNRTLMNAKTSDALIQDIMPSAVAFELKRRFAAAGPSSLNMVTSMASGTAYTPGVGTPRSAAASDAHNCVGGGAFASGHHAVSVATSMAGTVWRDEQARPTTSTHESQSLHRLGGGMSHTSHASSAGAANSGPQWPMSSAQMPRIPFACLSSHNGTIVSPHSIDRMPTLISDNTGHVSSCGQSAHLLQPASSRPSLSLPMAPGRPATGDVVFKQWHANVHIFFADIVSYTHLSQQLEPEQVMSLLHTLFSCYDALAEQYGVYKVETIGDCYMGCTGLDGSDEHAADRIIEFGKGVLAAAAATLNPLGGRLQVRAGVHSGRTMSGIVGTLRARYCLFGDTVNTASRMESTSLADALQVSDMTYQQLSPGLQAEFKARGTIEVKGKGTMSTWLCQPQLMPYNNSLPGVEQAAEGHENDTTCAASKADANKGAGGLGGDVSCVRVGTGPSDSDDDDLEECMMTGTIVSEPADL